jgi:vacuolar-type H+-ATPase subunit F/Vma7
MKVALVGPQSLARGFGLLGIETHPASSAKEAHEHVKKIASRRDIGVVLISEDFFHAYYEKYFQMKIAMERPILLEVPTVDEFTLGGDSIAQFVKKSTGVTV